MVCRLQKVVAQRSGEPVFDVIVELTPGALHEWRIVTNVAKAVDTILAGGSYSAQVRRRDCATGALTMELVQA